MATKKNKKPTQVTADKHKTNAKSTTSSKTTTAKTTSKTQETAKPTVIKPETIKGIAAIAGNTKSTTPVAAKSTTDPNVKSSSTSVSPAPTPKYDLQNAVVGQQTLPPRSNIYAPVKKQTGKWAKYNNIPYNHYTHYVDAQTGSLNLGSQTAHNQTMNELYGQEYDQFSRETMNQQWNARNRKDAYDNIAALTDDNFWAAYSDKMKKERGVELTDADRQYFISMNYQSAQMSDQALMADSQRTGQYDAESLMRANAADGENLYHRAQYDAFAGKYLDETLPKNLQTPVRSTVNDYYSNLDLNKLNDPNAGMQDPTGINTEKTIGNAYDAVNVIDEYVRKPGMFERIDNLPESERMQKVSEINSALTWYNRYMGKQLDYDSFRELCESGEVIGDQGYDGLKDAFNKTYNTDEIGSYLGGLYDDLMGENAAKMGDLGFKMPIDGAGYGKSRFDADKVFLETGEKMNEDGESREEVLRRVAAVADVSVFEMPSLDAGEEAWNSLTYHEDKASRAESIQAGILPDEFMTSEEDFQRYMREVNKGTDVYSPTRAEEMEADAQKKFETNQRRVADMALEDENALKYDPEKGSSGQGFFEQIAGNFNGSNEEKLLYDYVFGAKDATMYDAKDSATQYYMGNHLYLLDSPQFKEEQKEARAIFNKFGMKAFKRYVDDLSFFLDKADDEHIKHVTEDITSYTWKGIPVGAAGMTIANPIFNFANAFGGVQTGIYNHANGELPNPFKYAAGNTISTTAKSTIRGMIDNKFADNKPIRDVVNFLYDAFSSGIDSAAGVAIAGRPYTLLMGLSAMNSTVIDDIKNTDMSDISILLDGIKSGTSEGISEMGTVNYMEDALAGIMGESLWKTSLKQGVFEALEELEGAVLDVTGEYLIDNAGNRLGIKDLYSATAYQYSQMVMMGYDHDYIVQQLFSEKGLETLYSMAVAGVSTLFSTAPVNTATYIRGRGMGGRAIDRGYTGQIADLATQPGIFEQLPKSQQQMLTKKGWTQDATNLFEANEDTQTDTDTDTQQTESNFQPEAVKPRAVAMDIESNTDTETDEAEDDVTMKDIEAEEKAQAEQGTKEESKEENKTEQPQEAMRGEELSKGQMGALIRSLTQILDEQGSSVITDTLRNALYGDMSFLDIDTSMENMNAMLESIIDPARAAVSGAMQRVQSLGAEAMDIVQQYTGSVKDTLETIKGSWDMLTKATESEKARAAREQAEADEKPEEKTEEEQEEQEEEAPRSAEEIAKEIRNQTGITITSETELKRKLMPEEEAKGEQTYEAALNEAIGLATDAEAKTSTYNGSEISELNYSMNRDGTVDVMVDGGESVSWRNIKLSNDGAAEMKNIVAGANILSASLLDGMGARSRYNSDAVMGAVNNALQGFVEQQHEGQPTIQYMQGMTAYAKAGAVGLDFDATMKDAGLGILNRAQAQQAYTYGVEIGRARDASYESRNRRITPRLAEGASVNVDVSEAIRNLPDHKLNANQQANVDAATTLAELMRLPNLHFTYTTETDENGNLTGENGHFDAATGTIYINLNSGATTLSALSKDSFRSAALYTMMHEITHDLKTQVSQEEWNEYKNWVLGVIQRKNGTDNLMQAIRAEYTQLLKNNEGKEDSIDMNDAIEEIVANASEAVIERITQDDINDLATRNPSLLKRVRDTIKKWVSDFMANVRNALQGVSKSGIAYGYVEDVRGEVKELTDRWLKMVRSLNRNEQEMQARDEAVNEVLDQAVMMAEDVRDEARAEAEEREAETANRNEVLNRLSEEVEAESGNTVKFSAKYNPFNSDDYRSDDPEDYNTAGMQWAYKYLTKQEIAQISKAQSNIENRKYKWYNTTSDGLNVVFTEHSMVFLSPEYKNPNVYAIVRARSERAQLAIKIVMEEMFDKDAERVEHEVHIAVLKSMCQDWELQAVYRNDEQREDESRKRRSGETGFGEDEGIKYSMKSTDSTHIDQRTEESVGRNGEDDTLYVQDVERVDRNAADIMRGYYAIAAEILAARASFTQHGHREINMVDGDAVITSGRYSGDSFVDGLVGENGYFRTYEDRDKALAEFQSLRYPNSPYPKNTAANRKLELVLNELLRRGMPASNLVNAMDEDVPMPLRGINADALYNELLNEFDGAREQSQPTEIEGAPTWLEAIEEYYGDQTEDEFTQIDSGFKNTYGERVDSTTAILHALQNGEATSEEREIIRNYAKHANKLSELYNTMTGYMNERESALEANDTNAMQTAQDRIDTLQNQIVREAKRLTDMEAMDALQKVAERERVAIHKAEQIRREEALEKARRKAKKQIQEERSKNRAKVSDLNEHIKELRGEIETLEAVSKYDEKNRKADEKAYSKKLLDMQRQLDKARRELARTKDKLANRPSINNRYISQMTAKRRANFEVAQQRLADEMYYGGKLSEAENRLAAERSARKEDRALAEERRRADIREVKQHERDALREERAASRATESRMRRQAEDRADFEVAQQRLADEMHYGRKLNEADSRLREEKAARREDRIKAEEKRKQDIKDRLQHEREVVKERGESTGYRKRIRALIDDFNSRLKSPKKNHYIPVNMVRELVDALEAFDFSYKRDGEYRVSDSIKRIREIYERYKDDPTYPAAYDSGINEHMKTIIDNLGDTRFRELDSDTLKVIYEELRAMHKVITEANTLKALAVSYAAHEAAENLIDETNEANPLLKKGAGARFLNWQISPDNFFARLSGFVKNSTWSKVQKMFVDAEERMLRIQRDYVNLFGDLTKTKDFENLGKYDDKHLVDIGLKNGFGKTVKVTRGMMLGLYMNLEAEDNTRAIAKGGITIPSMNQYYNGKIKQSYVDASAVRTLGAAQIAAEMRAKKQIVDEATYEDLIAKQTRALMKVKSNIAKMLTENEKKMIANAHNWNDNIMRKQIDEVTLDLYGYKKTLEGHYWSLRRNTDFVNTDFDTVKQDATLANSGFMKERVDSPAPVLLTDFAMEMDQNVNKHSRYVAFVRAERDFNLIYNGRLSGNIDSVKNAVGRKFGAGNTTLGVTGTQYIEKYISDIVGNTKNGEQSIFAAIRRQLPRATLSLNFRVALSQVASVPTAAAELDWMSMVRGMPKGLKMAFSTKAKNQLANDDPWFFQRYRGEGGMTEFADIKAGSNAIDRAYNKVAGSKIGSHLLNWCQDFDVAATAMIHAMTEDYVQRHTNLRPGTHEFDAAVSAKYRDVLRRTQPMYMTTSRSALMRNNNELMKMFTMYKTQAAQNANILYDSIARLVKYQQDFKKNKNGVTAQDVAEARKRFLYSYTAIPVAAMVFAAFRAIANFAMQSIKKYRDDNDELTAASVLTAITDEAVGSMASMVVFGNDLYTLIESQITGNKYYGIEESALKQVENLVDKATKLATDSYSESETPLLDFRDNSMDLMTDIAESFGIPVKNANRFVDAGTAWFSDIIHGNVGSFTSDVARKKGTDYRRLVQAELAGDTAKYDTVRNDLATGEGDYDPQSDKQINKGIQDELADLYKSGKLTREKAISMLTEHGLKASEAEVKLGKIDYEKATHRKYSKLEDDFAAGLITYDQTVEYMVKYGGYTEAKAKEKLNKLRYELETGRDKDEFKADLAAGKISKADAIQYQQEYFGMTKDEAERYVAKQDFANATGGDTTIAAWELYYMQQYKGMSAAEAKEYYFVQNPDKTEEQWQKSQSKPSKETKAHAAYWNEVQNGNPVGAGAVAVKNGASVSKAMSWSKSYYSGLLSNDALSESERESIIREAAQAICNFTDYKLDEEIAYVRANY